MVRGATLADPLTSLLQAWEVTACLRLATRATPYPAETTLTVLIFGLAAAFLAAFPVAMARTDEAEVTRLMAQHDKWKDHLAPLVFDRGDNLAYTEAADTINPEQTAFARQMGRGIYMPVEDKVYVAVGYGIGETNVKQALENGELKIEGDQAAATEFFGYFDPPSSDPIKLVVR